MIRKRLLLLMIVLLDGYSSSTQDAFKQAYELTLNGQYDQAALLYEHQIRLNGPSPDLYYNLGTVYLNNNRIADARIALEKAYRLEPGNRRIQQQLKALKEKIDPQIEALSVFLPYQWFLYLRNQWTLAGWGWLFLILMFLSSALLFFNHTRVKWNVSNPALYILGLGLILSGLLYGSCILEKGKYFSILIQVQPLRIAPDSSSKVLLPLGVGSKTEVIDSLGEWYKVQLENNDQGWLPKANLKSI